MRQIALLLALALSASACTTRHMIDDTPRPAPAGASALQAAIDNPARNTGNRARDLYRHPLQTLQFFGVAPSHTVIEITPGGGWYTEVLAPYLRNDGRYVAAIIDPVAFDTGRQRDYYAKARTDFDAQLVTSPTRYDRVGVIAFDPKAPVFGAGGSADVVLTFRNVHNWRMAGQAEGMFKGFFAVLKPGGTLGVVEHRARADVAADDKSGYVGQAQVIAMAQAAGFVLDGHSEVNANPNDTKDHPNGVWMLPPSNSHDAADDAKYKAIGESDRMTLRFRKPR